MLTHEVKRIQTITNISIEHYRYGRFHRKNCPAIIWISGRMSWWEYSHRHRKNGPAVCRKYSDKEYWLRGQEC